MSVVVDFKNVDVIFGDKPAAALALLDAGKDRQEILKETGSVLGVAGANLQVEEGQICVLMGLSGSGKSSLLRCVNGLNTVSRGELLVKAGDGFVDMAKVGANELRELRRSRLAMVFQQFGLLPWASVRENVGFGLSVRGLPQAEIDKIVDEKLALVDLTPWADKQIRELSGGMQQRVGLARAFATDADILLMDEPFSALDPLIREHLQDELLELQRSMKKTIIFVSHDLDEALKIGDRIVIMDQGCIIQQGKADEIVFNPANDYVARFVANINPLNVLYAGAVMEPVGSAEAEAFFAANPVETDAGGAPTAITVGGQRQALSPWNAEGKPAAGEVVTVDDSVWLKDILSLALDTRQPMLVTQDGKLAGVITEREIYAGLLRREEPRAEA